MGKLANLIFQDLVAVKTKNRVWRPWKAFSSKRAGCGGLKPVLSVVGLLAMDGLLLEGGGEGGGAG